MNRRMKIERSSGNVFTDLGFPKAEAKDLMLRSELMSKIREMARGLTRARAAKRFGVTRSRLDDLLRGNLDKFGLDALVNMIVAAGYTCSFRSGRSPDVSCPSCE